jgi:hypothetical protein
MTPSGEQEPAPFRQAAAYRPVGVDMLQIGLEHVDLIEVGQQRGWLQEQGDPFSTMASASVLHDAIGLTHRKPGNPAKSPSVEQSLSSCSTAKGSDMSIWHRVVVNPRQREIFFEDIGMTLG